MAAFNLASKMAAKLSFQSFLSSLPVPLIAFSLVTMPWFLLLVFEQILSEIIPRNSGVSPLLLDKHIAFSKRST